MSNGSATGRLARRLAAVVVAPPIAYCALALALAVPWPGGSQSGVDPSGVDPSGADHSGAVGEAVRIFACDNGVHADLVLPVAAAGWDWGSVFPARHFRESLAGLDHVSIGWGSRDF